MTTARPIAFLLYLNVLARLDLNLSFPMSSLSPTRLSQREIEFLRANREIECLLYDNHQKGKMMIMITKTSGSQVDSPVEEGNRKEGGGRKMKDLHKDT